MGRKLINHVDLREVPGAVSPEWESEVRALRAAFPVLTTREAEVLHLISRNWDNREISERLFIAGQTVKNYTSRIYAKLGGSGPAPRDPEGGPSDRSEPPDVAEDGSDRGRAQSGSGGPPRRASSDSRDLATSSSLVSRSSVLTISEMGSEGSLDQKMPPSSSSE